MSCLKTNIVIFFQFYNTTECPLQKNIYIPVNTNILLCVHYIMCHGCVNTEVYQHGTRSTYMQAATKSTSARYVYIRQIDLNLYHTLVCILTTYNVNMGT
jgi:hypothetical protein